MRILIVNKFLYPNGGSETYIFSIGSQLQKMGHEVQYFGMEHEGRIVGNHAESYTENMSFRDNITGRRSLSGKISKLTYPFKIIYSTDARKKIRKVLEDFRPDVVHLNNINFQITPSVIDEIKDFDPNIRIVYTAHDSQWVCPGHLMRIPATGELCQRCIDGACGNCAKYKCIHNSRAQSILGTAEAELYKRRKNYSRVDTIIAPSCFMKNTLEHNPQLKGRIVTLHNAIDLPVSSCKEEGERLAEQQADAPLKEHGLLDHGYVLYYGRYDAEKGVDSLLEVCRRLPEILFVFAGKGDLEKEVEALPNTRNIGFQGKETLYPIIQHAKFTVIPSNCYENCPYSVMESELLGTPVLASKLGGIPELVLSGVTGELFEAGNTEELAAKVQKLWENADRLAALRDGCRRLAAGKLSLKFDNTEQYCRKLLLIYQGKEQEAVGK